MTLVLAFASAKAHNPNTSSVVVSPINGVWVIQYTISQEGANIALNEFYKDVDLQNITQTEYKKLYIKYIKEHTSLVVNNTKISLASGGIKLGSHQTDMKFLLPNFPKDFSDIQLKLNIFKENKGQHTVVKFTENDKSFRKVLNHDNNFSVAFKNTKTAFVGDNDKEHSHTLQYVLGGLAIILLGGFIYWRIKK